MLKHYFRKRYFLNVFTWPSNAVHCGLTTNELTEEIMEKQKKISRDQKEKKINWYFKSSKKEEWPKVGTMSGRQRVVDLSPKRHRSAHENTFPSTGPTSDKTGWKLCSKRVETTESPLNAGSIQFNGDTNENRNTKWTELSEQI